MPTTAESFKVGARLVPRTGDSASALTWADSRSACKCRISVLLVRGPGAGCSRPARGGATGSPRRFRRPGAHLFAAGRRSSQARLPALRQPARPRQSDRRDPIRAAAACGPPRQCRNRPPRPGWSRHDRPRPGRTAAAPLRARQRRPSLADGAAGRPRRQLLRRGAAIARPGGSNVGEPLSRPGSPASVVATTVERRSFPFTFGGVLSPL